jgi:hypothetical protein
MSTKRESKSRPGDDEIIDALSLHFRVHESVVVSWLLEIDLGAASQRIADSMAADAAKTGW